MLLFLGCPHPVPPVVLSGPLWELAKPASILTYDECSTVVEGMDPLCIPIEESWRGPVAEGPYLVWEVTVMQGSGADRRQRELQRAYFGPEGMGWLGTAVGSRPYAAFSVPELVLPANIEIGARWEAEVSLDGKVRHRGCELRGAPSCPGGVVSHCESVFTDRTVFLDSHHCPGVGFVGYEARIEKKDSFTLRAWSRNMRRDGVAVAPFR